MIGGSVGVLRVRSDHGGYANCLKDGRKVAGMAPKEDSVQPTSWTTYLASDDVDTTLARVLEAGGQVLMRGTDVPGSVTWDEHFSRAWKQCQDFYAAVVGWTYDDMSGDGFEYAAFKVADTDATVADLKRLGGSVAREPWDTQFGRMAAVEDDQGAFFMVMADVAG